MRTKQQKKFIKEISKIKNQGGNLYNDIYGNYTSNSDNSYNTLKNKSGNIRIVLFILFIGLQVYRSGILAHIIHRHGGVNSFVPKSIISTGNMSSLVENKRQKECSDYIQTIGNINTQITNISNDYTKEIIDYQEVMDKAELLTQEIEQLPVINHGEELQKITQERISIHVRLIEQREKLDTIRIITTNEEKVLWETEYEQAKQLENELNIISERNLREVKNLLEKYNMRYMEKENKEIEYYWHSSTLSH